MSAQPTPTMTPCPIGINATGSRQEEDSLGSMSIPADRYWGAQTQRSLIHFSIGGDHMPLSLYHAYGTVKKAAALVNAAEGRLPAWKAELIAQVADEVSAGKLDAHFPLSVWQTGSGTQTNMNVNEVIANRAIQLAGGVIGSKTPVHPNDDVNMGQSSNDSFPTAMHVATLLEIEDRLIPSVQHLVDALSSKAAAWKDVVKIGRTHLQDAVPLTVGQEWSGWACLLQDALDVLKTSREGLYALAAGGTAVGTGLNAPPGFSVAMAQQIAQLTGRPFITAPNKFAALSGLDAMARASAGLRAVAIPLLKIANDMRWLASGPRCGLGELILPENEPGSSIMPGKVNPTQCEALVMIATQVLGHDNTVAFAASQGQLDLNVMRPLILANCLHSIRILADGCHNFRVFSVEGTQLNTARIEQYVAGSVMLVTALNPVIGYDKAAQIAHIAMEHDLPLREAALRSGFVDAQTFDSAVNPLAMVGHGVGGA
ncbi:class II fumarate hydratase [Acetobacter vaccinii]|uniref:Fumarate hydratase class II n=1 Tax=Acetobacter vaccinii TaxID=2592655 RepID=A0A5C1YT96_9PROT|nr:class II fumarate hydratase [Acetobacter vaccinii]QEO18460.1 class II fumarate hydratase [Acetobacter vaccinii]